VTGRERIKAALSADGAPEIPAVICYEGICSRFIMSIGSPVTLATPIERVRLYCDLVREQ
jgi:hypothetical protein